MLPFVCLCLHMNVFVKNGIQGYIKDKVHQTIPPPPIIAGYKQIWPSLVIPNSLLYITHMPNYHCSNILNHRVTIE